MRDQDDFGTVGESLSESERQEWLIGRFDYDHRLLVGGKAWVADRPPSHLALDAIERMVSVLNMGAATPSMQKLLADYLQKVVSKWDEKTALDVLGVAVKDGRSNKDLERARAIDAYMICLEFSGSDEEALKEAWVAYSPEYDISAEMSRPAGDGVSAYVQQLTKTIKPLLHKAEVRKPDSPGRPRKSTK